MKPSIYSISPVSRIADARPVSDYFLGVVEIGERAGGYPALPTAKHDADKIVDFLIKEVGFDTVYVLTDEHVAKAKIDRLMTEGHDPVAMLAGGRHALQIAEGLYRCREGPAWQLQDGRYRL